MYAYHSVTFTCIVMLSRSQADGESCLERAELLIEIHLRDITTQKSLLTRNEMVAQRVGNIRGSETMI